MQTTAINKETGEIFDLDVQENRNRQNKDFVMLYRRFISQISDLGMRDVQALRILLFLVRHMDTKNALAVPMTLMSDMLNLSRQTVSNKLKFLQDDGWIRIMKLGRQNVYIVNPDVVWTSYNDQKQYCQFEATVMLSSMDQWDLRGNDRVNLRHIDRSVLKELAEREFPNE